MSKSKLDNFVETIWEWPTSELLSLYVRGHLRDGTHLRSLIGLRDVEHAPLIGEDARINDVAVNAISDEIDRRLPVARCRFCGNKPHSSPFNGSCPGETR